MDSGQYVKVFDVLDTGFKNWTYPASGLIFVAIGLIVFFAPQAIQKTGISFFDFQSKRQKFFRYFYLGFAVLWTTTSFISSYSSYRRHQDLRAGNGCTVVEGPVENFVPMPYTGHAQESFTVTGVKFAYSDYIVTDGFNQTASHGGPIRADSHVRICYDPTTHEILKLEIKDFNAAALPPAKVIEPIANDAFMVNPETWIKNLPWYNNLFIAFYLLDFVALLIMFLPYLRTFIRLKTVIVRECPAPIFSSTGEKIRLRNTILALDQNDKAIWLRPRGFNLFQVQWMAAKLNTDSLEKNVSSYEIRISSGFPLITVFTLFCAFQFYSANMPVNGRNPTPVQFIAVVTVLLLIAGFINGRIFLSRMGKIVEDALTELRSRSNRSNSD